MQKPDMTATVKHISYDYKDATSLGTYIPGCHFQFSMPVPLQNWKHVYGSPLHVP